MESTWLTWGGAKQRANPFSRLHLAPSQNLELQQVSSHRWRLQNLGI